MNDCFFIQRIRSFQNVFIAWTILGGHMNVFWISFPFLPLQKCHLGSQNKNFLSFPWGTFYLGPTYAFYSFLATVSSLVQYAAIKSSLVLDQLQRNNSESCESWHAFTFTCQYLTYLKNVNYRYCVLGKYLSTSLVSLWCFWSWIQATTFSSSPQLPWSHWQLGSGSHFCSLEGSPLHPVVLWCNWPVGWGLECECRMIDIWFLLLSLLSRSGLEQPSRLHVPEFPIFKMKIMIFAASFFPPVSLIATLPDGVTPDKPCKAVHLNAVAFWRLLKCQRPKR